MTEVTVFLSTEKTVSSSLVLSVPKVIHTVYSINLSSGFLGSRGSLSLACKH